MTRRRSGLLAAAGVACAVADTGPPEERGRAVLDALHELVPFVGGEISYWNPSVQGHRTLANDGYPDVVLEHLNGPILVQELDDLRARESGCPTRMRDVPEHALAAQISIPQVLRPQGYREGVTMGLLTVDGRHAGVLNLSTDDERFPTDGACAVLRHLNAALASVVDVTRSFRWLCRLLEPGVAAVALTAQGRAISLPETPVSPVLADESPALTVALAVLTGAVGPTRFLWPAEPRGSWYRIVLIPCRETGVPEIAGVVTARLEDDLHRLTRRELEVLTYLAYGRSNAEIAADLVVSVRTVSTHVERILDKLDVHSRGAAAARALSEGTLLPPQLVRRGSDRHDLLDHLRSL